MFGEATKRFSLGNLQVMLYTNKMADGYEYINTHFVRVTQPNGVMNWNHDTKTLDFYTEKEFERTFLSSVNRHIDVHTRDEDDPKRKINVNDWLISNCRVASQCARVNEKLLFKDNGFLYLNRYLGTFHEELKEFSKFSASVKKDTIYLFEYMIKTLSSNSYDHFDYFLKWICNICVERKLDQSVICFSNPNKINIRYFLEFLLNKVIGETNSLYLKHSDEITFRNNASLLIGKSLVVIDEPTTNLEELKKTIGQSKLNVRDNRSPYFALENIANCIIVNENAKIKDDFYIDMVLSEKENDLLIQSITAKEQVAKAFLSFIREHSKMYLKFTGQDKPKVKRMIEFEEIGYIDYLKLFIHHQFVLPGKKIEMTLDHFYEEVKLFMYDVNLVDSKKILKKRIRNFLGKNSVTFAHEQGKTTNKKKQKKLMVICDLSKIKRAFMTDHDGEEKPSQEIIKIANSIYLKRKFNKEVILPFFVEMVKEMYVLKNKSISININRLQHAMLLCYDFIKDNDNILEGKKTVKTFIVKHFGASVLVYSASHGTYTVKIDHKKLVSVFKKNGWLSQYDIL